MICKKCKKEKIDFNDFWSYRWRLCDGCQAAEEDQADAEREERYFETREDEK